MNFSIAQAAIEAFGDSIDVQEEIHGFRWVEERDLSGFVDGTENPAGEETRREVAVIRMAWTRAAATCSSSAGSITSGSSTA